MARRGYAGGTQGSRPKQYYCTEYYGIAGTAGDSVVKHLVGFVVNMSSLELMLWAVYDSLIYIVALFWYGTSSLSFSKVLSTSLVNDPLPLPFVVPEYLRLVTKNNNLPTQRPPLAAEALGPSSADGLL